MQLLDLFVVVQCSLIHIYIYMAYSRLLVDPGHAPKKLPVGTTEVQLYNQGDGT